MADKKISQLTSATLPLAGTVELPVVQSSTTVKTTVAAVQAAPVSAGTANAVQYLDNSKVPSTNANFKYDGNVVGITQYYPLSANWSGTQGFQLDGTSIFAQGDGIAYASNVYFDGTNYKYITAYSFPCLYEQYNGVHKFKTSSSTQGANNVITWEDALTIDRSKNATLHAGNLVQGTAAKGINFTANTPAAGMTSQLLNWYEEGTWTPTGFGGTVSGTFSATGRYTRIGRQVTVSAKLSATTSVSIVAGQTLVNNLPYSAAVESTGVTVRGDVAEYAGNICSGAIVYSAGTVGANANMFFSITYTV